MFLREPGEERRRDSDRAPFWRNPLPVSGTVAGVAVSARPPDKKGATQVARM